MMVAAILVILINGSPYAQLPGYAEKSSCGHRIKLPHLENPDHQPVEAEVKCSEAGQ